MIEKRLIKYLSEKVVFTSVSEPNIEKRKELGNKWINISVMSNYKRNNVYYATIKLFIYAPTLYECSSLSKKLEEALEKFTELENIQSCEINDFKEDNDTIKKRARYSGEIDLCYFE